MLEACLGRLFGGGADAIHRQSPVPENLNLDPTLGLGKWRLYTPPRLAVASDACRGSSGAGRFLHDGGGSGHLDAKECGAFLEAFLTAAKAATTAVPAATALVVAAPDVSHATHAVPTRTCVPSAHRPHSTPPAA